MDEERMKALRDRILEIDSEIIRLAAERLTVAREVGEMKIKQNLPVKDFRREEKVIERMRKKSEALGADPAFGEEISKTLIKYAVDIQKDIPAFKAHGLPPELPTTGKRILVIGGRGQMGAWLAYFLTAQGHRVSVYSRSGSLEGFPSTNDLEEGCRNADMIAVSAPLNVSSGLLSRIADIPEVIEEGKIIFDIASLKSPLMKGIEEAQKKGARVTSTHHLFGPNTEIMDGKAIVICDCGDSEATKEVRALFEGVGASLIDVSLEEHDMFMAYLLVLSHAINIAFADTLSKSGKSFEELDRMAPTTFQKQFKTTWDVISENPNLYYEIQALSPLRSHVLGKYIESLKELDEAAGKESADEFVEMMTKGKRYLER